MRIEIAEQDARVPANDIPVGGAFKSEYTNTVFLRVAEASPYAGVEGNFPECTVPVVRLSAAYSDPGPSITRFVGTSKVTPITSPITIHPN